MSIQGRLLRRKRWYTLDDAARRLTVELGEPATVRDVLQLALDGDISLCVMLQFQPARKVVKPDGELQKLIFGGIEWPHIVVPEIGMTVSNKPFSLDGIYRVRFDHESIQALLTREVIGKDACFAGVGSWSVESLEHTDERYMMFEFDNELDEVPQMGGPALSQIIVMKAEIEECVRTITEEAVSGDENTEDKELRALEALGLLIETMAKQSSKYRVGDAGRPNCAQIAEAMSKQAGDVYGMKPRTLQDRLSKAQIAWQEKCK